MSSKLTEREYVRRLAGTKVIYKSGFSGRNEECLHSFADCGHDFMRKPSNVLYSLQNGNIVCSQCRTGKRQNSHVKRVKDAKIAEIVNLLHEHHPNIELISYQTSKLPIVLFCKKHQSRFKVTKKLQASCFIGCSKCLIEERETEHKNWVVSVSNGNIEYVSGYHDDETQCLYFCSRHNKQFLKQPHKLKSHFREYGCIGCDECNAEFKSRFMHEMRTKVGNVAISSFKNKCLGIVTIETEVTFARELNVIGRFEKCGHRVSKSYQSWRQTIPYVSPYYSGCPVCEGRSGERIVYMVCQEEMPDAISQYSFYDDAERWPISVDVFSPSLHVVVEADGEQHKHSVFGKQTFARTRRRDVLREKICSDRGLHLLRIDTNELFPIYKHIEEIRATIKSFIRSIKDK